MKNSKTKRLLSAFLAVMFAMTMLSGISALASAYVSGRANNQGGKSSITLHAPDKSEYENHGNDEFDGTLGGMEVSAYQVLNQMTDELNTGKALLEVTAPFVNFFATVRQNWQNQGQDKEGFYIYWQYPTLRYAATVSDVPEGVKYIQITDDESATLSGDVDEGTGGYFEATLMHAILYNHGTVSGDEENDNPNPEYNPDGYLMSNAADAILFADWLRAYAEEVVDWSQYERFYITVRAGEGDTTIRIPNNTSKGIKNGYWLVASHYAPKGVANVKTVMRMVGLNPDDEKEIQAKLKAEYQGLTKEVRNTNPLYDPDKKYSEFGPSTVAGAGDILEYKVKYTVHDLTNYLESIETNAGVDYTYKITDTLINQCLVNGTDNAVSGDVDNKSTITIKFEQDGESLGNLGDLTNYLIHDEETGEYTGSTFGTYKEVDGVWTQEFVLNFDLIKLKDRISALLLEAKKSWENVTMVITYKAELQSDAALKNPNTAKLDYSNNYNYPRETKTLTDNTTVYSYGLIIEKSFNDDKAPSQAKLAGITFQLFEAEPGEKVPDNVTKKGDAIQFVEAETGVNGSYFKIDKADKTKLSPDLKDGKLKLDAYGKIKLYGLAPGYYVLKEQTPSGAATGYTPSEDIIIYVAEDGSFRLGVDNKEGLSWYYVGDDEDGEKPGLEYENKAGGTTTKVVAYKEYLTLGVLNSRGFNLPSTGGMGVLLFGIGGILLIAAAAYLLISQKKRNNA